MGSDVVANDRTVITEKQSSSRICVKNLPKYVTLDRLKSHFSQIGDLTDAKLLHTREGKSRRMGFIGYRTEQQAEKAIKYFNRSYLDTCRITCEIGWKCGDPNIPRPWSRYSKGEDKTADKKILVGINAKIEKKTDRKPNEIDDPQLKEFLGIMRPCSKRKIWANDLEAPVSKQVCTASEKPTQLKQKVLKTSIKELNIDGSAQKEGEMDDENLTESHKMAPDSTLTDMDYFRSKIKKDWSDSESDADENESAFSQNDDSPARGYQEQLDSHGNIDSEEQECLLKGDSHDELVNFGNPTCRLQDANRMLQTSRLYVWNLPYASTEGEVAEFFNTFGNVKGVHLVIDRETKQPRGYGYVHYSSPEEAARALGDQTFQGRIVHVVPAENERGLQNSEIHVCEGKGKTYKQQREEKRKALEANGNTQAWNSLFMRSDTIVENIARKYGVSKSVLLDREADDVAVRIALGETKIIAETKEALTKAGVNVASLEKFASRKSEGAKRSNHVILVKNLPFSSSEGELSKMFGGFGSLEKVIFPPTRTLALVIFVQPAEARAAFDCLRYKRYRDSLLYLEWAPSNILCQDLVPSGDTKDEVIVGNQEAKEVSLKQQIEEMIQAESDSDRIESRTLYVTNLDFGTTDERLGNHFREHVNDGKLLSATVRTRPKNGKRVSSGYGFVEFDSVDTANNVIRVLQGTILDGHVLSLQFAQPEKDTRVLQKAQDGRSSTKLIVNNVPFQATKNEIRQLFSPFGQVKCVRLPKKFGEGKHRGFAFVDYFTKQEAENALKALSRVHLYGRPMVIDRANQDETLEELRARTAAQFANDGGRIQNPTQITHKRLRSSFR